VAQLVRPFYLQGDVSATQKYILNLIAKTILLQMQIKPFALFIVSV